MGLKTLRMWWERQKKKKKSQEEAMKGNGSQESELEIQTLIYQRDLTHLCSPKTLKDIMSAMFGTEQKKSYFKRWLLCKVKTLQI